MSKAAKFLGLTAHDQRLLLRTWLLLSATVIALYLFPARRVFGWFNRSPRPRRAALDAGRALWAVSIAGRYVPGCRCLAEALVARHLLAALGVGSTLRIGVAPQAKGMDAHAWLERNGEVLIGGAASPSRYKIIFASANEIV